MKAHLDCIVCQQRQALRILQLATEDQHLHESVLRQVMDQYTAWLDEQINVHSQSVAHFVAQEAV